MAHFWPSYEVAPSALRNKLLQVQLNPGSDVEPRWFEESGYEDAEPTPQDLSLVQIAGRRARANRIHWRSAFLVFKYLARPSKRISAMSDQGLGMYALRKAGLIIAEHHESGTHNVKETIASLIELLDRRVLAAAMDLEWDYRLWLVKWFPMLFDILTVFLLVAGCMLLWLNLRPRSRDVDRSPKETSDRAATAYHPEEFAAHEPRELIAEHRANAFHSEENAFPSEESVNTDAAQTGSATAADQNSYADRVASAMAKLRKPSAGL